MYKKYIIPLFIAMIAVVVLIGCNTDREKKVEDAQDNVEKANLELKAAEAQYEKEWQQFKYDVELKIIANEKSIIEYKSEIKTASNKFKIKYESEIVRLEAKNAELKKRIAEYKYEGKDKWEEFKLEFGRDVDAVGQSLKDIFSKKD
ncbi:MAG: hypothetical protein Q8N03_13205 [Ignavibacteria bacterium]|jgi:predicted small secreted protein|nr:hypothetical protein [Ignavibacteria bacterium]